MNLTPWLPLLLAASACEPLFDGAADSCVFGLNDADEKVAQCDANLLSQKDVEALADVVEVTGHLAVRGGGVDDLGPLDGLRRVGGSFSVMPEKLSGPRPSLRDLTGLEELEVVGGDLHLLSTDIEQLGALGSLRRVGGSLELSENERLADVDGLAALERIGGDVYIRSNPALTSLSGLGAVTAIGPDGMVPCDGGDGGGLEISDNAALATLDGLQGITEARVVSVNGGALTSVDGLRGLQVVESLDVFADGLSAADVEALRAGIEVCD